MEEFTPNHIPKKIRMLNLIWACVLIGFAIYWWLSGYLHWPGRAGSTGVTFTSLGLVFFISALISAALNALLTVIDYYDKRNNETQYKKLSRYLNIFGVIAIMAAFGYQYVHDQKPAVVINNGS